MSNRAMAQVATKDYRRQVCFCAMALLLTSLPVGCASGRMAFSSQRNDPMAGAPRIPNAKNPHLEDVLVHLNNNTERIQSWRADNVRIQTAGWTLSGKLAVERANRVRLVVSSPMGSEVDLGSNDERFWVWSKRLDPAFVTCKHENMEIARQKMGIPFEPQWLMQTLGVSPLPVTGVKMEAAPNNDQARLIEEVTTAHGYPLRRVVLVDLRRGIVVEHSLYDYNGVRIALARLSGHQHDKATGIVIPHRVMLEWPQNQMSIAMDLGKIQINPKGIPDQIWEMPEMPRYQVVNLDAGMDEQRVATQHDAPVRFSEVEGLSSGDADSELDRDDEDRDVGRARLSERTHEFTSSRRSDDSWNQ